MKKNFKLLYKTIKIISFILAAILLLMVVLFALREYV